MISEKTKWYGLWNNREGVYSGQCIKKADIPAHARIVVMNNRFYEKGGNRPEFVYCFANGDASKAITMEKRKDEYITLNEARDILDKIEKLRDVIRKGNCNGDFMMLPSDSQSRANALMREAIGIVEEMTGEKWSFSYLTWW